MPVVLSTSEKITGIVYDMKGIKEDDGNYQFNLLLDQRHKKLLNEQNNKQVNGMLVIEIIPKDQLKLITNSKKWWEDRILRA